MSTTVHRIAFYLFVERFPIRCQTLSHNSSRCEIANHRKTQNTRTGIAKFLQFQLTVNVTAVTLACIGAFVFSQSPLKATQMLWVNLIMDSLGALALASEPPEPDQLQRPPYGRNRSLVSFPMKFNIFGHAFYQMIVLLILLFAGAGDLCKCKKDDPVSCLKCPPCIPDGDLHVAR